LTSFKWSSLKLINIKGDLFATGICFGLQTLVRLGSSLILTRIVRPDAYGIITIMMSITFVIEMISDINVSVFIVRDQNAEQPRYLNTAWTIRLARSVMNTAILFLLAPWIASSLYSAPVLGLPLRVFSISFVIGALQSMSVPLAIRRKQARYVMYMELAAASMGSVISVILCYYLRSYWGMIYGILANKIFTSAFSYLFYRDVRPKIRFDWTTAREILQFSKFNTPSSLLSLAMSQFDKVVFLRLFDLTTLGVYGLATNIAGSIEALISKVSQSVLYARCAHNFRTDPEHLGPKYYTENVKLFISILFLPAAIGGAAHFIITVLYPSRYEEAGAILQAFMLRATLLALGSPAEDLLIAIGQYQVILHGNVFRAVTLLVASLTGYYFFGFMGFTYGAALSALPPLIYYWRLQQKHKLLTVKYESYKVAFVVGVWICAYASSSLLMALFPHMRLGH
jgi:O-antigen/teichoic acid export membrane protein